ncbi:hypothetical protein PAAL109150_21485 [Paenibacillus alkaliterrae]|nr:hypothetical protein [Paenibacillus alkaliterrae]
MEREKAQPYLIGAFAKLTAVTERTLRFVENALLQICDIRV